MKIDYTNLSFTQLIDKIESNRFFDIPRMVREAFTRLLTRVEALEDTPSAGIESVTGDYVDNTDPSNPVLNDPRPYKVYTALLYQSGTDAPVATVLENTLGDITYSIEDLENSYYTINSDNLFIQNKTAFTIAPTISYAISMAYDSSSKIYIFASSSDNLSNTFIEIRVYN